MSVEHRAAVVSAQANRVQAGKVHADKVTLSVVDSHTGGEPTRVITAGFPELQGATLAERRDDLASRFRGLARRVVDEPRGNEAMVAALLTPPTDARCHTGVIFFDRSDVLGMCGHGTIGLVETLHFLGEIGPGQHLIDTPVGPVTAQLHQDGSVSIDNVVSRRLASVTVEVPAVGAVAGEVAWGGNTFFCVEEPAFDLSRDVGELITIATAVKQAVHAAGYDDVDHVELYGEPTVPGADSRSFVLCPSGTYDRSPCGTGTSAKLACLAVEGRLAENEVWVQESITGSTFEARYRWVDRATGEIAPQITGRAEVTGRGELFIDLDGH